MDNTILVVNGDTFQELEGLSVLKEKKIDLKLTRINHRNMVCISSLNFETHKHSSVSSVVYIKSGLIFIEKCQIFQCKTKCKQKIKLSCVYEFQILKKQC